MHQLERAERYQALLKLPGRRGLVNGHTAESGRQVVLRALSALEHIETHL